MSYISISTTDKAGKSSTFSASKITDAEKQRAKDFIDALVSDDAGGDKEPA